MMVGIVAGVLGSLVSAAGTIAAGQAQQNAMEFQAKQEDQNAQLSRASSQRTALEHQRQEQLAQSQLQANAAASGAGATDPTVVNLGENIAGRGRYQSLMDIFNGEQQARGFENQANADRYSGQMAAQGSMFGAAGTLIGGFGSAFDRYNQLKNPTGGYAPAFGYG